MMAVTARPMTIAVTAARAEGMGSTEREGASARLKPPSMMGAVPLLT